MDKIIRSSEHPFKITDLHQLLKEEGYLPKIDEDGDILFKSEGKTLCIFADRGDPDFVRITLPHFWSIDSELERELVMKQCCAINENVKVAKVFLVGDSVWASIEMFISPVQSIHDVLHRSITVLHLAAAEFSRGMIASVSHIEDCDQNNELGDSKENLG